MTPADFARSCHALIREPTSVQVAREVAGDFQALEASITSAAPVERLCSAVLRALTLLVEQVVDPGQAIPYIMSAADLLSRYEKTEIDAPLQRAIDAAAFELESIFNVAKPKERKLRIDVDVTRLKRSR